MKTEQRTNEEKTAQGMDKVTRYNWSIKNAPGEFLMIPKSELEVDEVLKEVVTLGATIIKPAQKVFWGGYSGYFKELDGHVIEVAYNPFWALDENDNLKL